MLDLFDLRPRPNRIVTTITSGAEECVWQEQHKTEESPARTPLARIMDALIESHPRMLPFLVRHVWNILDLGDAKRHRDALNQSIVSYIVTIYHYFGIHEVPRMILHSMAERYGEEYTMDLLEDAGQDALLDEGVGELVAWLQEQLTPSEEHESESDELNIESEFVYDTIGLWEDSRTPTHLIVAGTPCVLRERIPGGRAVVELKGGEFDGWRVLVSSTSITSHKPDTD